MPHRLRPSFNQRLACFAPLAVSAFVAFCAPTALAQYPPACLPAIVGSPLPGVPGVLGEGRSAASWDPDGPGPEPEWLVVSSADQGASIYFDAGVHAFDGTEWRKLTPGWSLRQCRLFTHAGALYAIGSFTDLIGWPRVEFKGLARCDQPKWTPIATSWTFGSTASGASIGGRVFAVDAFEAGSSPPRLTLRRLEGAIWVPVEAHPPGSITSISDAPDSVGRRAVALNVTDQAGSCATIQLFDGTDWTPMAGTLTGTVRTLHWFNDTLFAAGDFLLPVPGTAQSSSIALWNGVTWEPVGTLACSGYRQVFDLNDDGTAPVISVRNTCTFPSAPFNAVAQYDGTDWRPMGRGFFQADTSRPSVFAYFHRHGGQLFAYGAISDSDEPLMGVARWDQGRWAAPGNGFNAPIRAFAVTESNLFAVGDFTSTPGGPCVGVARFDGASWHPVGAGVSTEVADPPPSVFAAAGFGNTVVVGGTFSRAGAAPARNIARFDGDRWSPLASGFNGPVRAVAHSRADLIAGGDFSFSGTTPLANIARWNGVAWQPMGDGVNAGVRALVETPTGLVAAGDFTAAGPVPAIGIASWDGRAWSPLGVGLAGVVHALAMHEGELHAAGDFTSPPSQIQAWDGAQWRVISYNYGYHTRAIASFNSALINSISNYDAERTFTYSSYLSCARPCHPGTSISVNLRSYGSKIGARVLAVFNGELHIGGGFHNGGTVGAAFWSRMRNHTYPEIVEPYPWLIEAWPGDRVELRRQVTATEPLSTGWYRTLEGGVLAFGEILVIDPVLWSSEGNYQFQAANPCGTVFSSAYINLYPDIIEDGAIDIKDLRALLSMYGTTVPPGSPGDRYADGSIGQPELLWMLRNFGKRRPPHAAPLYGS